jgi:hypothetical protein
VRDGQDARVSAVVIVDANRRERLPERRNALIEPGVRRRECVQLLQRGVYGEEEMRLVHGRGKKP